MGITLKRITRRILRDFYFQGLFIKIPVLFFKNPVLSTLSCPQISGLMASLIEKISFTHKEGKIKKIRGSQFALMLGIVAVVSLLVLVSASVALADDPLGGQIAQVRAATVHFHDIQTAQAAGYGQFLGCISEPGQGAMGIHFPNGTFVGDTILDPLRPEAMIYEPETTGQLRLVAMEYIMFAAVWDAEHSQPPSLFGQTFHLVGSPNRYGLPPFYELHLWAWKHNPNGMFYDWNPTVTCP